MPPLSHLLHTLPKLLFFHFQLYNIFSKFNIFHELYHFSLAQDPFISSVSGSLCSKRSLLPDITHLRGHPLHPPGLSSNLQASQERRFALCAVVGNTRSTKASNFFDGLFLLEGFSRPGPGPVATSFQLSIKKARTKRTDSLISFPNFVDLIQPHFLLNTHTYVPHDVWSSTVDHVPWNSHEQVNPLVFLNFFLTISSAIIFLVQITLFAMSTLALGFGSAGGW